MFRKCRLFENYISTTIPYTPTANIIVKYSVITLYLLYILELLEQ